MPISVIKKTLRKYFILRRRQAGIRRLHFKNCKKASNPSLKIIEQHEKLQQRIISLN